MDKDLLLPINQCKLTGIEHQIVSEWPGIKFYKDCFDRIRIVCFYDSIPVGSLLMEKLGIRKGYVIKAIYVDQDKRRQGIARSLLAIARIKFKKVAHSNFLSEEGLSWAKAVEGVN